MALVALTLGLAQNIRHIEHILESIIIVPLLQYSWHVSCLCVGMFAEVISWPSNNEKVEFTVVLDSDN